MIDQAIYTLHTHTHIAYTHTPWAMVLPLLFNSSMGRIEVSFGSHFYSVFELPEWLVWSMRWPCGVPIRSHLNVSCPSNDHDSFSFFIVVESCNPSEGMITFITFLALSKLCLSSIVGLSFLCLAL